MSDDTVVTMPKLGETVTEGTIGNLLKQVGDTVSFDDPLFEVSTDKVDSEIPSPADGVIVEILVASGDTVPVGAPILRIGAPGSAVGHTGAARLPSAAHGVAAAGGPALGDAASPSGSGVGGRIRREDIERTIATASPSTLTVAAPPPTPVAPAPAHGGGPVPATPAAPIAPTATAGPATLLGLRDETVPLPKIRLVIADRTVHSLRVAPHVWTSVEVDLDAIERIRARHKERFRREEGMSLTQLAFVARAVCDALRAFPNVNSSLDIDTKTRILHHYVNLGIAVDLNEQGLVAPVIRDADTLNLRGLARAIRAVAQKATGGKLVPDDLTGSTFTITSPGPIADYASAPIINQPNSAILSLNMITRRPVAVGDVIAIHPMTILGFCYDHRSFDGVTTSRFMAHVRDSLQGRDWEVELA